MGLNLSNIFKFNDQGDAPHLRQLGLDEFQKIKTPTAEELQIQLQKLVQQGLISPEMAQAYLANPTAFNDIHEDPATRDAQMKALSQLQDYADDGGTAQTNARVADIQDQLGTTARGAREAVMERARARGVGGSGMDIANQMLSSQEASTNAFKSGTDAAAEAEARAMDAISKSGSLSGEIRGADYQTAADKARAADAIDKFNVANRQSVETHNVDANNRAQELNLEEKQRISDQNIGNANANAVRNSNLKQQQFEDEISRANGVSGAYDKMAEDELTKQRAKSRLRQDELSAGAQFASSVRNNW